MKTTINKALILLLMGFILIKAPVYADELGIDYPHCSTYDIGCSSCHYMFDGFWPAWVTHEPANIDDTPYNNLCQSCHTYGEAPFAAAHSSITTSEQYDTWSIECRTCHWPHHQKQLRTYGADSYVYTATSTSITFNTLTDDDAEWTNNQYQGYILIPNLDKLSYNYKITGNTGDTLTISVGNNGYMKRKEDFERGNFTNFQWITGGDADWTIQSTSKHSGEYAAQAPTSLGNNEMSYLEVQLKITGAGNISFWYRVSSEEGNDYLRFLIDGEQQDRWSGEVDWTQGSYPVSISSPTFRWEYTKGSEGSAGSDTAWIDDIIFIRETVEDGDTFAIIYGKLIKSTLPTPNSRGRTVKIFRNEEGDTPMPNSFADGDSTYDGVCEVCHTQPDHFSNDGSGLHENIGGGQAGANCMRCHSHENGFRHGAGGDPGTGCGTSTSCHGQLASHPVHVTDEGMETPLECSGCHDEEDFLKFADGEEDLSSTTVCDTCHSPGGHFDGVDDLTIGAKANWDNGAYNDEPDDDTLRPGKEKWCVGCHDAVPSIIQSVSAPDIGGDDTTYGYYVNGHGKSGFSRECTDCHDTELLHTDGISRTFSDDYSVAKYNDGYRLIHTPTQPALEIPRSGSSYDPDDFTLCFSCHNELDVLGVPADYHYFTPSIDPNDYGLQLSAGTTPHTNFRNEEEWGQGWKIYHNGPSNAHWDHVSMSYKCWDIDYDGSTESRQSCVSCHNPHGTKDDSNNPTVKMTRGDMDITFDSYNDGLTVYNYGYIGSGNYQFVTDPNPDLSCWGCHDNGEDDAEYGAGDDPDGGTRYYRLPWQTPAGIEGSSTGGFDSPASLWDDSTSSGSTIADGSQWVSFDLGDSYLVSEVRLFASSTITSQWDVFVSLNGIDWGAEVETTWQVGSDSGGANRWYGTSVTNKEGRYIKLEGERTNGSSGDLAIFEFDFLWDVPWMTPVNVDPDTDFSNPTYMIDDDFDTGSGLDYVVEEAQEVPSTCPEHVGDGDGSTTVFYLDHGQVVVGPGNYPNVMINWEEQLRGTVYDLDFENGVITFKDGYIPALGATIDACYHYLTDGVLPAEVVFDMGDTYTVDYVRLYGHKCSDLNTVWDVHVSLNSDGPWTSIITGWIINNSQNYWYVHANDVNPETSGRYIKLTGGITSSDPEIMLKEFQFHTE